MFPYQMTRNWAKKNPTHITRTEHHVGRVPEGLRETVRWPRMEKRRMKVDTASAIKNASMKKNPPNKVLTHGCSRT